MWAKAAVFISDMIKQLLDASLTKNQSIGLEESAIIYNTTELLHRNLHIPMSLKT